MTQSVQDINISKHIVSSTTFDNQLEAAIQKGHEDKDVDSTKNKGFFNAF